MNAPAPSASPVSPFDLTGRRIWLFGGAGYLGREVTKILDVQNAHVVCADLPGRAEAFVAEGELSSRVSAVSLDLTRIDETDAWISSALEEGTPDGAVFLAMPSSATSWEALSAEEFDQYHHDGLTAPFLAIRRVGQAMAKRGSGSVVLFSSMYGVIAPHLHVYEPPMPASPLQYGMHKAAISQMARYLSVAWGPKNVRCNAVAPGPFPNPRNYADDQSRFIERLGQLVPMGRVGNPHEIAGIVAFLVSDTSTFITGQNLAVDGGWTAW